MLKYNYKETGISSADCREQPRRLAEADRQGQEERGEKRTCVVGEATLVVC